MNNKSIIEKGMIQWRIVLTFCTILVAFGVYSFFTMPRQEFPDFTIRQGIVVGIMPGATTREVEARLAKPVEEYLFSFNEVNKKKTCSISKEGQLVVFVELNDSIKGADAPAFWTKLRHGLNELRTQKLPGQVLALIGNNDFGDTSALLFTVVADGKSPRELLRYLEVLENNLRRIDETSKLRRYGTQDEVIRVSISRDRLARYGIRPLNVWSSLQGVGAAPAPARLDGDDLERPIHVTRVMRSEAELGDTIILSIPTGPVVRLKDVAEIKREYGHDDSFVRYNGKTAILLSIEMQSGNDITTFGVKVDRALKETISSLPPGVVISRVADQPFVVKTSINHFLREFGLAIVAVIIVTMLFLPIRIASVAAISIPVCIAITLAVLNALGVQLQTVSLAGLIVVLGMVVDNAIVIIDDYVLKLDQNMDPWTAAWKSARELMVPVFTATVAIILSYVPMPLIMKGTAADFTGSLPVTIAVALITSMLVAFFLVPIMNFALIKRGLRRNTNRRSFLDHLQHYFDRALEAAFRHPWLTLSIGLGSFAFAMFISHNIKEQTFPGVDRNQFTVEVYLPNGRSLKETDAVMRRLEQEVMSDKRVINVTSFIGQSSPRFHTVYAPKIPSRNFGQLLVNTINEEATVEVLRDKQEKLRDAFPEAWVQWRQLVMSLGTPVEVRLSGNNIEDLKRVGAQVEEFAKTIPGTTRVYDDYEEALQTIDVVPDADACSRLGVPPAMLQMSLALGTQGFPIATIWEDDYPVRVILKDESRDATTMDGLRQQYVSSMMAAATVPLEQLASVKPAWQDGAIVRRNGVRTLTVKLDIGIGVLGSEVQKRMEPFVGSLKLPPGMRVEFGGDKELSKETLVPQTHSMIVSIALIFIVLLCQFKRFRQTILVMLSMPLSIFGAFIGLVIMGYPFGMTAFMGIIGLMGIVVRNGIILVTYAEELRSNQGMGVREAALAAGKRRMRPIYLTSMAAAVGVVPMILSKSTLWGPLGTVTAFGLVFAMVLTLFVLPVSYWLLLRNDRKASGTN
ncbi:MAG: efflux RND transporter permease subunit, partial [Myxococcota bacterium]